MSKIVLTSAGISCADPVASTCASDSSGNDCGDARLSRNCSENGGGGAQGPSLHRAAASDDAGSPRSGVKVWTAPSANASIEYVVGRCVSLFVEGLQYLQPDLCNIYQALYYLSAQLSLLRLVRWDAEVWSNVLAPVLERKALYLRHAAPARVSELVEVCRYYRGRQRIRTVFAHQN
jgi:hypothetical protein